jgi:RNA polymerase-binding transcription factor DksA
MKKEHSALKAQLEKIKAELDKQIHDLEEKSPDFGSDTDHFEDETLETTEHQTQFGIAHELRKRLADVETALEKIDEGTYGKCETCGMEIEVEVLKLVPESRYCKQCKTQMVKDK